MEWKHKNKERRKLIGSYGIVIDGKKVSFQEKNRKKKNSKEIKWDREILKKVRGTMVKTEDGEKTVGGKRRLEKRRVIRNLGK